MLEINNRVIKTRIKNKYDTKQNFDNASFIPLKGEILFYDIDGILEHRKMKIGDGVTPIGDLPFADKTIITDLDDHRNTITGNPHNVTKADVDLNNVVNTGDSATPVEGGTTKFTTGGAYTELAKKADKATTLSGYGITDAYTSVQTNNAIADAMSHFVEISEDEINALFA